MSKSKTKRNFRDDWDDEEEYDFRSEKKNKQREKRIQRALKTRDIDALLEQDEPDEFERHYSKFEEDDL